MDSLVIRFKQFESKSAAEIASELSIDATSQQLAAFELFPRSAWPYMFFSLKPVQAPVQATVQQLSKQFDKTAVPEDEMKFNGPRKSHPRYAKFFELLAQGKNRGFVVAQLKAETNKTSEFLDEPDLAINPLFTAEKWPRRINPVYQKFFDLLASGKNRGFVVAQLKAETGKGSDFLDNPDMPVE
ncbi:Conserved_hypothetical protein [Hexamita inflata]|uniref:Uncharacterized protein n=1 Tax=Hexamita inflata TaxID=28002 RepID=A0AA86P0H8_9EUKA|nr:Conserved hypothetical protein [Hexamita inflata]